MSGNNTDMANRLVVIENGEITIHLLDGKENWTIGRDSSSSKAEIRMKSPTISRNHGKFSLEEGFWFYSDYGKNGTIHNGVRLKQGLGGRIRSVMLEEKDVLVFGAGTKVNTKPNTVWTFFMKCPDVKEWRVIPLSGDCPVLLDNGKNVSEIVQPKDSGRVFQETSGGFVHVGDRVFLYGDWKVEKWKNV